MSDETAALDVSEQGKRYVLAQDEAGWGVWKIDSLDEPLVRYGDGDDAYQQSSDFFQELERRHCAESGQWLPALRVVALIAGIVWVVARTYYAVRTAGIGDNFNTTDLFDQLRWIQAIDDIAYAIFLFAAVAYVILWLRRRDGGNG